MVPLSKKSLSDRDARRSFRRPLPNRQRLELWPVTRSAGPGAQETAIGAVLRAFVVVDFDAPARLCEMGCARRSYNKRFAFGFPARNIAAFRERLAGCLLDRRGDHSIKAVLCANAGGDKFLEILSLLRLLHLCDSWDSAVLFRGIRSSE